MLDVLYRRGREQLAEALEELGLGDVERVDRRRTDAAEIARPLEGRREPLQLVRREFVVDVVRVAARDIVERALRQRGFDPHDGVSHGAGVRRRHSHQRGDAADVLDVLLPQLHRLGVVAQVIVAIGQPESALVGNRHFE